MDKSWLIAPRSTVTYRAGLGKFIQCVIEKSGINGKILYPCKSYGNRYWLGQDQVNDHLICDGFMNGYSTWIFHGETPVFAETKPESEPILEEYADSDEMGQMLLDGFGMYDTAILGEDKVEIDEDEFDDEYLKLVNDDSQYLYTGFSTYSKLQFIVRILNIKNNHGMTNDCFDAVLNLFKETLPEGQSLPNNFYESKKYISAVELGYETVHACRNVCLLFSGPNGEANSCSVCDASRWKSVKTGIDGKCLSKVPAKVARHFVLDNRVHRMFISSETSPHTSWHTEGRIQDGLMRHPADSPAWKHFDAKHKSFSAKSRNLRFGLATDGFNPFGNKNSSYSIWPIILIPYNLPPWLCMKQSNFILSVIVPGRKAPNKDIDVYLQLTLSDLSKLWVKGILT